MAISQWYDCVNGEVYDEKIDKVKKKIGCSINFGGFDLFVGGISLTC